MGRSVVHEIINETCEAIWQALQLDFMKPPTRQDWEQIEKGFRLKWHFPNCVGALDGNMYLSRLHQNPDHCFTITKATSQPIY